MNIDLIIKLTDNLRKQMKFNLPIINKEIENIISNKDRSVKKIEQTLDTLLDYAYMNVGVREFKKLNNYYSKFNKENAELYDQLYQEIITDEY